MRKLLKILPFVLLVIACDNPLENSVDEPKNFVQPNLKITSETITPTNSIQVVYTLTNFSNEKVTYGFSSGCQFGYLLKKNNKTIFDLTKNVLCTLALTQFDIKPFESKKFEFTIYSSYFDQELEKGTYSLQAFLLNDNGKKAETQFIVE